MSTRLIECLRGSNAANGWLSSLQHDGFAVPGVVALELLMGCRNPSELRQVEKFLKSFRLVWPEASDFERSYSLLLTYRLSSGLGIPDSLIAAMARARASRLYTFNLKHFRVVAGLDVQEPYPRSSQL